MALSFSQQLAMSTSAVSFSSSAAPSSSASQRNAVEIAVRCSDSKAESQDVAAAASVAPHAATTATRRQIALRTAFAAAAVAASPWIPARPSLALIEGDDDEELLERVKRDRKERITRLGAAKEDEEVIQNAVFQLGRVGQAIESADYSAASSALSGADWTGKVDPALRKVGGSSSADSAASTFLKSVASLESAVGKADGVSAKKAFVASATALENFARLSGLSATLKGL